MFVGLRKRFQLTPTPFPSIRSSAKAIRMPCVAAPFLRFSAVFPSERLHPVFANRLKAQPDTTLLEKIT
jgi:hypothetical protein